MKIHFNIILPFTPGLVFRDTRNIKDKVIGGKCSMQPEEKYSQKTSSKETTATAGLDINWLPILKTEAALCPETSVNIYQSTRLHLPEDSNLRENMKFYKTDLIATII
jgi:hypothetical protein